MISDHLLGHIGQYAFIKNSEGAVLLRKTLITNKWGLPGGRIEEGENWEQSLTREVKEETDLDIADPHPVAVHMMNEGALLKYCVYFAVQYRNDGRIRYNKKTHHLQWVSYDEANSLTYESPGVRDIVLAFLRNQ